MLLLQWQDVTLVRSEKEEEIHFKCFSCKNMWSNKEFVVKHNILNHEIYSCLNCDDWVKDKSRVMDANWSLNDQNGDLRSDV